jgi:hypothetical protein
MGMVFKVETERSCKNNISKSLVTSACPFSPHEQGNNRDSAETQVKGTTLYSRAVSKLLSSAGSEINNPATNLPIEGVYAIAG